MRSQTYEIPPQEVVADYHKELVVIMSLLLVMVMMSMLLVMVMIDTSLQLTRFPHKNWVLQPGLPVSLSLFADPHEGQRDGICERNPLLQRYLYLYLYL